MILLPKYVFQSFSPKACILLSIAYKILIYRSPRLSDSRSRHLLRTDSSLTTPQYFDGFLKPIKQRSRSDGVLPQSFSSWCPVIGADEQLLSTSSRLHRQKKEPKNSVNLSQLDQICLGQKDIWQSSRWNRIANDFLLLIEPRDGTAKGGHWQFLVH